MPGAGKSPLNSSRQYRKDTHLLTANSGAPLSIALSPVELSQSSGRDVLSLLIVPALLKKDGSLQLQRAALPWIPRSFLEPGEQSHTPTISKVSRVSRFFSKYGETKFEDFSAYWKFSEAFFYYCSGQRLEKFSLPRYKRAPKVGIFPYTSATRQIAATLEIIDEALGGERDAGCLEALARIQTGHRTLLSQEPSQPFTQLPACIPPI